MMCTATSRARLMAPMETDLTASLRRLDALARLMDSAFEIPGTGIRFGLDAVVGLVPGIGDALSSVVSFYLIKEARRLGAPRFLVGRMLWNVLVDTAVGSVPVAGDLFDVMFRANLKNMSLLRSHLEKSGVGPASATAGKVIDGEFTRVS